MLQWEQTYKHMDDNNDRKFNPSLGEQILPHEVFPLNLVFDPTKFRENICNWVFPILNLKID